MLYMRESTLKQTWKFPVLFDIAFPHTHMYVYIKPPEDDKKGIGVKKWNHAECFSQNREIKKSHSSNADNGKSSHMTSLPQHELSEGFENVNFLKKKTMKRK